MYLNSTDSTFVTGQSMWLLLQHRSGTCTPHEPSTVQKNCPTHLSVPVMERGRTEVTVRQGHRGWQTSWCFSRIGGLSQGNEGSRGTPSWDKPCNSTFVPTSKCSLAQLQGQTDSWQLPLPEISPEALLLYLVG